MSGTVPALLAAALVAVAVVIAPRAGQASRWRLRRWSGAVHPGAVHPGAVHPGAGRPGAAGQSRRVLSTRETAALTDGLAGGLRAGLGPARAWSALAGRGVAPSDVVRGVLPWLELGLTSGQALRRACGPPGTALVALAVALDVCERSGAPTADVLEGLAAALREEDAAAVEREIALAAPRATARVMAALPAVGFGMSTLLGADTLGVLTMTWPGRACLVVGGTLWTVGHWWIRRLVASAAGTDPGEG